MEIDLPIGPQGNKKKIRKKNFMLRLKRQKYLQLMAIPGIIWMLIFNYIPMYGIIIAFKKFNIVESISSAPWVGFKYFIEVFQDEQFMVVMKNTLGISFYKLAIGFSLPILFALFLNELKYVGLKKIVQTISYLPHFLSWVILGGILMTWLSDGGVINNILLTFHIIKVPTDFLAEPNYFWAIAVISDIWKELGWSAIIYLAAIASIDQELYEAATMDGAGRFVKMFRITLPCIKPTIVILFILAVSGILNANFDQILVLNNQLNASSSNVIDLYVYRMGIVSGRFSYSAALGLFKSIIAFILLVSANTLSKKLNETSLF
ncbi:ABC transporter permease [Clostridium lacusfryxellense]|uniref:ABC transporter permease n=1 Tax=Clostridium lacusfryxellense TaxID=205328 RepID=UPI001FE262DF|nr:ABC transporter permease subunit [Clostridium lacusfryxellense]